jgi:hypothetical protein
MRAGALHRIRLCGQAKPVAKPGDSGAFSLEITKILLRTKF